MNFTLVSVDTNVFYSYSNIRTLFDTTNQELNTILSWFQANKLSLWSSTHNSKLNKILKQQKHAFRHYP